MIQKGVKVALGIQVEIKTNQFSTWSTKELREWVDSICCLPDILTIHIFDICLQAVEELNIREGVYGDEMLH